MKIRVAYIEEAPFYWTGENQVPLGSDIELAEVVLRAIGVSTIEYCRTTFEEFLPGVQAGRWDMNVPIFVSPERQKQVAFSVPVWALGDGFVLRKGNPKALVSYESVAANRDSHLGLVTGTVQFDAAKAAGVDEGQIVLFKSQPDAVSALLSGGIDAYVATAVGNREIVKENVEVEAVYLPQNQNGKTPVGAFSFDKNNHDLLRSVNAELRRYLGSQDHRQRMEKYGITGAEIDGVIA